MKKIAGLLALIALGLSSCDYGIVGNGNVEERKESIGEFTRLEIDGNFDVYLEQTSTPYLRIEADENLQDIIKVRQNGNQLEIEAEEHIMRAKKKNLYIGFSDLARVDLSGAIDIKGKTPVEVQSLAFFCSGAVEMRLEVLTEKLRLEVSGAANIDLEGRAQELDLQLSGAGDFKAVDLRAERVRVELSGAAQARVYATEDLRVDISGAGSVRYKGEPQIHKTISGVGSLKKY